jgi:GNAT superfamily N-acetyltransferase
VAQLRVATVADALGIARVHVDSWRTTYRGLLPDDLLDNLSYESRAEGWERFIARGNFSDLSYVAEEEGEIVGFVHGGPVREFPGEYTGEIYAIYLLASQHGKGTGRALFEQAATGLAERGFNNFMLWVLDGNPTRGFYEHMGGVELAQKQEQLGGKTVTEIAYGWKRA